MKKFRFALLALAVSAITFAFTPNPEKVKMVPYVTYYAFDSLGNFMGSASSISILKAALCPGADQIFCVQVWTSMTVNGHPAGTRLSDIQKPLAYIR